ncbi:hypothetical protein ABIA33_002292 [Streptacidiphilus sp. MAP12-16]
MTAEAHPAGQQPPERTEWYSRSPEWVSRALDEPGFSDGRLPPHIARHPSGPLTRTAAHGGAPAPAQSGSEAHPRCQRS